MSNHILLNRENILEKVTALLEVKGQKKKFEEDILAKIQEIKDSIANSYSDVPELAKLCKSSNSRSLFDKEVKFEVDEFNTLNQVIEHYIGAFAGDRCLTDLGWDFDLTQETFSTITDIPHEKVVETHAYTLFNFVQKYIEKKEQLQLSNKLRLGGVAYVIVPIVASCLANLLYRLTDSDMYFVSTQKNILFETEFFTIQGRDHYDDDQEFCLLDINFKDEKFAKLVSDVLTNLDVKNTDDDLEDDGYY